MATGGRPPAGRARPTIPSTSTASISARRGCSGGWTGSRGPGCTSRVTTTRGSPQDVLEGYLRSPEFGRAAEPLDRAGRDRPRRVAARAVARVGRPAGGGGDGRGRAGHARADVGQPGPAVHRGRAARADGRAALERGVDAVAERLLDAAGRARPVCGRRISTARSARSSARATARRGSRPGSRAAASSCRRSASPPRSRGRSPRPRSARGHYANWPPSLQRRARAPHRDDPHAVVPRRARASSPRSPRCRARRSSTRCCSPAAS